MFQAVLDAIVEAFVQILEFVQDLLSDWFPFDLTSVDMVAIFAFANNGLTWLNLWGPINEAIAILLAGAAVKYAIRVARLLIGPLG